jgi:hypothetical protein
MDGEICGEDDAHGWEIGRDAPAVVVRGSQRMGIDYEEEDLASGGRR